LSHHLRDFLDQSSGWILHFRRSGDNGSIAMTRPYRIEGYAIISADGMLADAAGVMPPSLKIEADQRFFHGSLDRADVVVHGRHSHEGGPNAKQRRRLIVTRRISALAPHPENPKALLWNPAGASFEDAWRALGVASGVLAVIGGTEVFGIFLDIGYDAFHLCRAARARLPGGRPVFPEVPARTPEDLLQAHGLEPGPTQMLDAEQELTLVTWRPRIPASVK
jgi:dihydrofolate reductase